MSPARQPVAQVLLPGGNFHSRYLRIVTQVNCPLGQYAVNNSQTYTEVILAAGEIIFPIAGFLKLGTWFPFSNLFRFPFSCRGKLNTEIRSDRSKISVDNNQADASNIQPQPRTHPLSIPLFLETGGQWTNCRSR
jgi:hypothetical protein